MKVFFQVMIKLSYISQVENGQKLTLHSQLPIERGTAEVPWLNEQNNKRYIDNQSGKNIRCPWIPNRCSLFPRPAQLSVTCIMEKWGESGIFPLFRTASNEKMGGAWE